MTIAYSTIAINVLVPTSLSQCALTIIREKATPTANKVATIPSTIPNSKANIAPIIADIVCPDGNELPSVGDQSTSSFGLMNPLVLRGRVLLNKVFKN